MLYIMHLLLKIILILVFLYFTLPIIISCPNNNKLNKIESFEINKDELNTSEIVVPNNYIINNDIVPFNNTELINTEILPFNDTKLTKLEKMTLDDDDLVRIDKLKCSKDCCKFNQWDMSTYKNVELPKKKTNDDYVGSNLSCNFGEGSGCVCTTPKILNSLTNRR